MININVTEIIEKILKDSIISSVIFSKCEKVFISGPTTNEKMFTQAEIMLRLLGYEVFNPTCLSFGPGWEHEEIWDIDLAALSHCDKMVQLPGWKEKKGCKVEEAYCLLNSIPMVSWGEFLEVFEKDFPIKTDVILEYLENIINDNETV